MSLPPRPRLLVIVGPTGTGKSTVAVHVAERLGGEIVGCDALQLYRGFDVGTAKPTPAERARVPHHLIDALEPEQDCSVGDWVRMAEAAIAAIAGRGRVPLIVGGSGMYLRGLLRGVVATPARDPRLVARLNAIVARGGSARLHRRLARLDPESARRLHPSDGQRVVRALELALTTDAPWSERLRREGTWERGRDRYPSLKVGLDMAREPLHARLQARVERFWAAGLVSEVRRLRRHVPAAANAFRAIGYREIVGCLEEGGDPDAARERVLRNTRRYAKRQRSWFRREPDVEWLDASTEPEELAAEIVRRWHRGPVLYSRPGGSGPPTRS